MSVWLARPTGKKVEGKRDSESVPSVANSLLGKGKRRTGGTQDVLFLKFSKTKSSHQISRV